MKKLFERALSILDFIIPKNEKIIVFGGNEMRGINGNVAAVLKSWLKNPKTKGFKIFTISIHEEKFSKIETIDPRTFKGIFTTLRAKTAVVSHVYGDLYWYNLYNGKRRRVINLWHGSPLKRIGPWRGWGKTTALIAASKMEKLALSSCIEFPLESIFITGFPRNDMLIKSTKKLREEALAKLNFKDKGQKWILYTPTHRKVIGSEGYLHHLPDFSSRELKKTLEKHNAYLIVRSHINYIFPDVTGSERVIVANFDLLPEVEPLYALADMLITDYSSTMFEYLILNRPILGLAADLPKYSKSPGLLYDYETIFPGPIAKDWNSLKKLIEEAFKDPSKYESIRKDRLVLFHKFLDGNSTKRVIDLITDLSIK